MMNGQTAVRNWQRKPGTEKDQIGTLCEDICGGARRFLRRTLKYNAAGQKERESYGTGGNGMTTPLYLKLHYNRRHQMVDLRLGSSSSEWNYDRGALVFYYGSGGVTNWNPFQDDTDNNGNVQRQVNYVPKRGGGDVIPAA